MKLTPDQLEALERFIKHHGRSWREMLAKCWHNAAYGPVTQDEGAALQQLRNTLGPDWLAGYRKGDTTVGDLQYVAPSATIGAVNYRILPHGWKAEDAPLAVGWGNLKEARDHARRLGITIIKEQR